MNLPKLAAIHIATTAVFAAPLAYAAGAPTASLQFLAAPAVPAAQVARQASAQSRHGDRMVVVVHEPAACGQRLSAPRMHIEGGRVELGYDAPRSGSAQCVATGIFSLRGLPAGSLEVVARAQDTGVESTELAAHMPQLPHSFLATQASDAAVHLPTGIEQVRHGRDLVAIVRRNAACGTRLEATGVSLDASGRGVDLHVRATAPAAGESCVATGIFTLHDLPSTTLLASADFEATPLTREARPLAQAMAPVRMNFLAGPAIVADAASMGRRVVSQFRSGHHVQVVVREPTPCGDRASAPSFDLAQGRLRLQYRLPANAAASQCVGTVMASFEGVPSEPLSIEAHSVAREDSQLAFAF